MHGHSRITEHGLWTRRGDRHVRWLARCRIDDRILKVPKMPFGSLVKDFVVADRRLQKGVPIDQSLAAKNQSLAEQVKESGSHGPRADFIQA